MKRNIRRDIIEIAFIIFLFYSNLLMSEFTRSGMGHKNGLLWAVKDIFTLDNFIIALATSFMANLIFEYLRRKHHNPKS